MNLSTKPPKGTSDWYPDEFAVRKYIFDTWRRVCESFGYEEYLTPIIETADIYRAKSGDDVGGKELMTMTDRAGREYAIRPEMTPSVIRMVSNIYESAPKPIRYFSIANYLRNEKPQKGRNREFWQLNFDVFGSESINSDVEILIMAIEIMKAFGATSEHFVLKVNDRNLTREFTADYLNDQRILSDDKYFNDISRSFDKIGKKSPESIAQEVAKVTGSESYIEPTLNYIEKSQNGHLESIDEMNYKSKENLQSIISSINNLGYGEYIRYDDSLKRGFDYYDGMVFEVFDKNPENNRSLFGGGRYNGLASIFGKDSFPAVGCAPGDETTKIFLETWNLLPKSIKEVNVWYLPMLDENLATETLKLANLLRKEGKNVEVGVEVERLGKALNYADKKNIQKVVIFGDYEKKDGVYKIKDMKSGEEEISDLRF